MKRVNNVNYQVTILLSIALPRLLLTDSISVSATTNEHEPSGNDGDGLSVGLITAIVLAGLAFLSVIAVAVVWFFKSKRSQKLDLKTCDEDMNGVEIIY